MRGKVYLAGMALFLLGMASPGWSADKRPLSDAELDKVTAGGGSTKADAAGGVVNFQFQSDAASRQNVEAKGTITIKQVRELGINVGSLLIRDSAQSNLRSLVNINAVNSPIQVLINLNVNINSRVGELRQINVSGLLPR